MKKIVTIAAIAALTTLTACGQKSATEADVIENVEALANEAEAATDAAVESANAQ